MSCTISVIYGQKQCHFIINSLLIKSQPHPRNYPQTPINYRHTDNHLRLVMVVFLIAALGKAELLISTTVHQKFDLDL